MTRVYELATETSSFSFCLVLSSVSCCIILPAGVFHSGLYEIMKQEICITCGEKRWLIVHSSRGDVQAVTVMSLLKDM